MSKRVKNPIGDVFKYLSISILFMFFGVLFGQIFIPAEIVYYANYIIMFMMIGLLIFALLSRKQIIPRSFSMNFVYLFTFIDGVLMYPIIKMYTQGLGVGVVLDVLIGTVILMGVLSFIANRKEAGYYMNWGPMLFSGLVVLLVFSLINLIMGSKMIEIGLSVAGIVIFSLYTLYDINLIKHDFYGGNIVDRNDLSIHVLNLYLDFINIFLDILRLLWALKED